MRAECWRSVQSDRWQFTDDISRLEARSVVKAVERMCNSKPVSSFRVLILGDNLGVILAFSRRRARDFRLLIQIRRVVALCLARGVKCYFRWIPSEFNSADFGSRVFDTNESKTLTSFLQAPLGLSKSKCKVTPGLSNMSRHSLIDQESPDKIESQKDPCTQSLRDPRPQKGSTAFEIRSCTGTKVKLPVAILPQVSSSTGQCDSLSELLNHNVKYNAATLGPTISYFNTGSSGTATGNRDELEFNRPSITSARCSNAAGADLHGRIGYQASGSKVAVATCKTGNSKSAEPLSQSVPSDRALCQADELRRPRARRGRRGRRLEQRQQRPRRRQRLVRETLGSAFRAAGQTAQVPWQSQSAQSSDYNGRFACESWSNTWRGCPSVFAAELGEGQQFADVPQRPGRVLRLADYFPDRVIREGDRSDFSGLDAPRVSEGLWALEGREDDSCSRMPSARIRTARSDANPLCIAVPAWVASLNTPPLEETDSLGNVVRNSPDNVPIGLSKSRNLHAADGRPLFTCSRDAGATGQASATTNGARTIALYDYLVPQRRPYSQQDGDSGRVSHVGQSVDGICPPSASRMEHASKRREFGQHGLRRVLRPLSQSVHAPWADCSPQPSSSLRGVLGSGQRSKNSRRGAAPRPLAEQEVDSTVRTSRHAKRGLDGSFGVPAPMLPGVRGNDQRRSVEAAVSACSHFPAEWQALEQFADQAKLQCCGRHGQCSFQKAKHVNLEGSRMTRATAKYSLRLARTIAKELVYSRRMHPEAMVLDIFGGSGIVAKQCGRLGYRAYIIEKKVRETDDATSPHFLDWVRQQAQARRIQAMMIATPCSSFSLAQSRGRRALRTQSEPRGKSQRVTPNEQARIDDGNKVLDATIALVKLCNVHRIPYCVENPATSYLWYEIGLADVLKDAKHIIVDQCAFGAKWRKRTRLVFGNLIPN